MLLPPCVSSLRCRGLCWRLHLADRTREKCDSVVGHYDCRGSYDPVRGRLSLSLRTLYDVNHEQGSSIYSLSSSLLDRNSANAASRLCVTATEPVEAGCFLLSSPAEFRVTSARRSNLLHRVSPRATTRSELESRGEFWAHGRVPAGLRYCEPTGQATKSFGIAKAHHLKAVAVCELE